MVRDLMASQYVVLDMFAGAGGLSEGFFRQDFNIISHIEMDAYAAQTLHTRTLYHALVKRNRTDIYYEYYNGTLTRDEFLDECRTLDIIDTGILNTEISSATESMLIDEVRTRLNALDLDTVDVIVGGPPCQAYSLIGRGRDPGKMRDDPRNHLYLHYLKFIQEFEPELFVFENVPGLISARNGEIYTHFIKQIDDLGYISEKEMLNAQNFGVLQDRKRIILIGWKKENDLEYPAFPDKRPGEKIWSLLKDLPVLKPGEGTDGPQTYRVGRPSDYLRKSGIRTGGRTVRQHIARPHNERDREIYQIAIRKWNNNRERLRYNELPEFLKTHQNQSSFLDRFKVVDGGGISHAVVAHIAKDGHYYIHPDIQQARSLTVREAARIQSFPDSYLFEGSRSAQYIQIGNAVPPLMSQGIAAEIISMLDTV